MAGTALWGGRDIIHYRAITLRDRKVICTRGKRGKQALIKPKTKNEKKKYIYTLNLREIRVKGFKKINKYDT